MINIVDEIVPLADYVGNVIKESTPGFIKNKINKRNRILKNFKRNPNPDLKKKITDLNCKIKSHFIGKLKF